MQSLARAVVVSIGIVGALTALMGIRYTVGSIHSALNGVFDEMVRMHGLRYFYPAFYIMAGTCLVCYVTILACSIAMFCLRLRWIGLLIGVLLFEIIYFFAIAALCLLQSLGRSVAAGTGVANGGLSIQLAVLLPLWAPLALWWAKRELNRYQDGAKSSRDTRPESAPPNRPPVG